MTTTPTATFAFLALQVTPSSQNPTRVTAPTGFTSVGAVALAGFEVNFSDGKDRALETFSISTSLQQDSDGPSVGWTIEFTDGTSPGIDYTLDLVVIFSVLADDTDNTVWAQASKVSITPPSSVFGTGSNTLQLGANASDAFNLATLFGALSGFTFEFADNPANHFVEAMGAWVSTVPTFLGAPPLQAVVLGGARIEDSSSHAGYNGVDAAVVALGAQDPTNLTGFAPTFPVVQPYTVANNAGFSGSWGQPSAAFTGMFLLQGFKLQSTSSKGNEKITSICVAPQTNPNSSTDVTDTQYGNGNLTMNGTYTVEATSGTTVFATGTAQVLYVAAAS
jgi:hypothetical protein